MFYVVNCARLFNAELLTVKQVMARENTLGERERHPFLVTEKGACHWHQISDGAEAEWSAIKAGVSRYSIC